MSDTTNNEVAVKDVLSDRPKPLIVKDGDDVAYTLEFSRESVQWAEKRGFKIGEVSDYPLTGIYSIFFYSFRMHHPSVTRATTDAILKEIGASSELLERLGELYNVTVESLMNGADSKNRRFTVEF